MSYRSRTQGFAAARANLLAEADRHHGQLIDCPLCEKGFCIYERAFHNEMAIFLCNLVALYQTVQNWYHVRDTLRLSKRQAPRKASTDGSYLVYPPWALVYPKINEEAHRVSGYYRPSKRGIRFVQGRLRVPSHLFISNDHQVRGDSGKLISIHDALATPLDLDELLGKAERMLGV